MKTGRNRKSVSIWIFAAAGAISLAIPMMRVRGTTLVQQAKADEPRVIEIKAKKFEFSPSEITLKKGEPVILRLTSEDRTHGFLVKPLKIDTDIVRDKVTDVPVTPELAGNYTIICDHYCGTGHGNMKMKLTVVE
jgi:cytochrome c oxidase subunit 2